MLILLQIKHFALIQSLSLDFDRGLTVMTGETGAGKSIWIDALFLALGARADNTQSQQTRPTQVSAAFDISSLPDAQSWLKKHTLDDEDQCILRRHISVDGRSRATINGTPVTLQQLRQLSQFLIHIHGQHEHQSLQKEASQRLLLDQFAQLNTLCDRLKTSYDLWHTTRATLTALTEKSTDNTDRLDLLRYQLNELQELSLEGGEVNTLHTEQRQLSQADMLITQTQKAHSFLSNDESNNALTLLYKAQQALSKHENVKNINDALTSAIQCTEDASDQLHDYLDQLSANPKRLLNIEKRLDTIHDLARKHHVTPEMLHTHFETLKTELNALENTDEIRATLEKELAQHEKEYRNIAKTLSDKRKTAAKKLSKTITDRIQALGMPGGTFNIDVHPSPNNTPSAHGLDTLQFLLSANPGHPLQPLSKVASGGELSRISLAIQVSCQQDRCTPTLIFDEVDVGIGGNTANKVGTLLQTLGEQTQVLCITHLPQVAACGHHHIRVEKSTDKTSTTTRAETLDRPQRIQELARMLGGNAKSPEALANAEILLAAALNATNQKNRLPS